MSDKTTQDPLTELEKMRCLLKMEAATSGYGTFSLELNPQSEMYWDVADYLNNATTRVDPEEVLKTFVSKTEYQRAIKQNTLVELTWYPSNQIGSYRWHAADLDSLFGWLAEYDFEAMK